ncbi:MAG: ABC transporter permease [Nitrospiraceae bacterium]|nr:MAG: ABC transporter permease [Nitrospiraceae bacterium]
MRIFFYSFQTAIKNLWCDKWINFLTTLTIAVGLLILGTFIFITVNMDSSLKRWSKGFGLIVYIEENTGKDEEELLREYFQKDTDITDINYISKESALDDFRTTLGEMSTILEGFHENPLPASFELKLKREALDPYYIKQKAYQIGQLNGVNDVQYGEKWLSSLHTMTKGMKIIILFLGGIIFTAIAFTTYSTMKILFYRRIEEINTLKLLGATRGFIRFPFILEGFFIGIFGGLVGFLGILVIHNLASSKIIEFMPAMRDIIIFFPLESYPVAPLAGALMSIVGSLFAVGKIRY